MANTPIPEMVERVAMAISGKAPDEWATMPDNFREDELGGRTLGRSWYREKARAAIAAMREMTEAMWEAAKEEYRCHDDAIEPLWQAMIDAALGE